MDEFKLLEPVDNSKGCVVFYAEDYRTKRRVKPAVGPNKNGGVAYVVCED